MANKKRDPQTGASSKERYYNRGLEIITLSALATIHALTISTPVSRPVIVENVFDGS